MIFQTPSFCRLTNAAVIIFLLVTTLFLTTFSIQAQSYTFTSAGATGTAGPTQTQLVNAYASTSLNGLVTSTNGTQYWTVPTTGVYRIEAYGAKGGNGLGTNGAMGAKVQGDFSMGAGTSLKIVVGQMGTNGNIGGGGGGSFVTNYLSTIYCAAGGGGGAAHTLSYYSNSLTAAGTTVTSGMGGANGSTSVIASVGGSAGGGGSVTTSYTIGQGSGGGGWIGDGVNGNPAIGGFAFTNGAYGGIGASDVTSGVGGDGGFGGGGGGDWSNHTGAGGGGGYSGGGGGSHFGCGGGGGSFTAGSNPILTAGINSGNGYVVFTKLSGVNIVQTASVNCNGQLTAALTASAYGGQAPYTYSWSPGGSTSATITGLGAGTYTCQAIDAGGISYSAAYTITQPAALTTTGSSQTSVTCNGGSNGAITLSVSGGTSPYTYSWSPGNATTPSLSGLSAGTYSYVVKDQKNCTLVSTVTITQPAPLGVQAIASQTALCSGQSVQLAGIGASTYTWSNGVTNGVAFTPVVTRIYTVTGASSTGCIGTATITIIVSTAPALAISASSNSMCSGSSVTLSASGASSYTWSTSETTNSITVSPVSTTVYSVIGTNGNSCQGLATTTVVVISTPVVTANSSASAVCFGNNVTLFGSGATSYAWSNGVSNNVPFSPAVTAGYSVTGTNACGTASSAITVTVNSLPLVTASASSTVICNGSTVSVSGAGASTYAWANGITNGLSFSPSGTNTYTVTGTDANGCQNTASKTISVNALPTVSAIGGNTSTCSGNSITLSGAGAVTYTWTNGITNNTPFIPSTTSNYIVTGTDANGCKNTAVTSVTVVSSPTVTANASNAAICAGGNVTLSGSGATTYTWSNGITNNSPFSPAGTATYTLTGANACFSNTAAVTVTVNPLPAVTASVSNAVVCSGNPITFSGNGALTYTWSNGIINNNAITLNVSGVYTVAVTGTDANGCRNTAIRSLTFNPLPTVTASASNTVFCFGNSTTLNGSGASTYTWSGGVINNVSFIPAITTTYTVTGSDANGCQNTAVKTITVNPLPVVTAAISNSVICSGTWITVNGSGANTYTWSNGPSNGLLFMPLINNSYSVTGTNTLTGCTSTNAAVVSVTVNSLPVVTATAAPPAVCYGSTTTLTASGATTYTWSNGVVNGASFLPTATGSYTVTGTSAVTGCTNTAIQTVTVRPLPVISIAPAPTVICYGGSSTLTASGATSYTWTGGLVNGIYFFPPATVSYTVTGLDITTGCTNTAVQGVTVNPLPVVTAAVSNSVICAGDHVILSGSGANAYSWSGGIINGVAFAPTATGSYSLTGTNTVTGCQSSNTAVSTIVVNNLPVIIPALVSNTICSGETTTVSASGAATYTWNTGETSASVTASLVATTPYTVTATDVNGCKNTASIIQYVSECTGINSVVKDESFSMKVYPNPNNGQFFVSAETETHLVMMNELGQIVTTLSLNAQNKYQATVTAPGKGVYVIVGKYNNGVIKQKLIVTD